MRQRARAAARPAVASLVLLAAAALTAACGGNGGDNSGDTPTPTPTAAATAPAVPTGPAITLDGLSPAAVAAAFDPQRALADVRTLAEPQFMGRHAGTAGELLGAQYIAEVFRQAGLQPGGDDGTYLQQFGFRAQELAAVPALELTGSDGTRRALRFRDDFRPYAGAIFGGGEASGPAVFGGTGTAAELARLDLRGKVLVVAPQVNLRDVARRALAAGAVALVSTTGRATLLKGELQEPATGIAHLPLAQVSQSGAAALLEGSGHTRDEINAAITGSGTVPSFPLAWSVRVNVPLAPAAEVQAHNVIGVLPAATATDRTVVVGAHYEEIGPDPDGVVYPAANDNASGTAVLLELARLLGAMRPVPNANIVLIGWSGHEEGLLGSAHYVTAPRFPLSATALYINLDTVGQGAAETLHADAAAGPATALLNEALARLAQPPGPLPVRFGQDFEGGSDHINFRNAGVPTLSLAWDGILTGSAVIHTPADTADGVDPAKLRVTGVLATLVTLLAAR